MSAIKLLLCMTLIAASLGIGCHCSSRLSDRIRILGRYITLLEEVSVRMTYTCDNLAALFSDNFADYAFFDDRPFDEQFRGMTLRYRDVLNADDIRILDEFTCGLGASDTDSQLRHLRLYLSLLRQRLESAREDEQKKGRLYRVIPLSAGIAAAILMI